ncbi:survival protein SurA precursor [Buchnera aphidicola str. Ua (Uroleucon ambrosiae)]|uniref:Survival protein SurA n=2 Tax=Buchnera aphidicola TaxID=9 RepID=G2LP16_BUCUM|nr:survival protein SurA precursor [Buchnera aphidicola str. Ua (Uroleucon ambrosiae)]
MKLFIFVIFYIFTSIFSVSAKTYLVDNIVAIVNDQIILNSDVNRILSIFKKKHNNIKEPIFKHDFLKEKVIQKLITHSLMLQEANRMNIEITQEQINTIMKNIALKKHISMHDLNKRIILYNKKHHHYYDDYIQNIKEFLKINIIENYELHKRIQISEKEVNIILKKLIESNNKLKKINLSYILLPISKEYSNKKINDIKTIAKNIKDKIQKGYDFGKSLIDFKNNPTVLVKKMFWMSLFDIHNQISQTLKITKKGEILGPFLGAKGFYILKIHEIHNNQENLVTEFHIQNFLIKSSISKDGEDKKHIFNIYENIKKGIYSFDYAVKHFSHDTDLSHKKGDLGWVSKEFLNMYFNKKHLHFNKHYISKPIKSHFGWHILKLLNTRQVDQFYNFKKKQAYNILFIQKKILAKQQWINNLKKNAYIKIIKS